mmetsp:Transcript_9724/g.26024  ORF Transcript_9724/g.26024 Transcript_9724/m.26024 type:complete len:200 (-) Transcript_9724:1160-1759(-)
MTLGGNTGKIACSRCPLPRATTCDSSSPCKTPRRRSRNLCRWRTSLASTQQQRLLHHISRRQQRSSKHSSTMRPPHRRLTHLLLLLLLRQTRPTTRVRCQAGTSARWCTACRRSASVASRDRPRTLTRRRVSRCSSTMDGCSTSPRSVARFCTSDRSWRRRVSWGTGMTRKTTSASTQGWAVSTRFDALSRLLTTPDFA